MEMLLTGEPITAQEAHTYGLVNKYCAACRVSCRVVCRGRVVSLIVSWLPQGGAQGADRRGDTRAGEEDRVLFAVGDRPGQEGLLPADGPTRHRPGTAATAARSSLAASPQRVSCVVSCAVRVVSCRVVRRAVVDLVFFHVPFADDVCGNECLLVLVTARTVIQPRVVAIPYAAQQTPFVPPA